MSSRTIVKVMLADDHSLYRAGLRELLEEEDVKVVGEASNGEEAVLQAARVHPDVVVMDVRMPLLDGIEASRQIKAQLPETEIVMVTGAEQDEDQMFRAINAGARSYVGKDESPEIIVEAVRSAAQGAAYLPPQAVKMLFDRLAQRSAVEAPVPEPFRSTTDRLTEREKDVLRLLAKGRRNNEIASELRLSVRSVGNHLAKIYNKLHIHGRSEAVLYAIRHGIAEI